jgi:ATP-binding protein involved in chromosome partitioning
MADPRIHVIAQRLRNIHKIIAVSSGKGGVGKSLVASVLALTLARKGFKVGLFDLDFTSPSSHVILGIRNLQPKEDKGIIPPVVHGFKYMSIVYYSGEKASPLRGADISNALIELLAVTMWDELDYLVIDMPPGISDATLDLLRFVRKAEFLVVTTPSRLSFQTVNKFIDLLSEVKVPVLGVIENMKIKDSPYIEKQVVAKGLRFWGDIAYDTELEENIGNTEGVLKTEFGRTLKLLIDRNLQST